MTEVNQSYFKVLDEICASSPDALRWLLQAIEAASTWDHIVDGDDIESEQTDRTFMALLTEWPLNPFFNKYASTLVPVMVNAISSWKFSNKEKAPKILSYAIYTELPTTVAFILLGNQGVDKLIPRLRDLALTMHDEDEKRDNNRK